MDRIQELANEYYHLTNDEKSKSGKNAHVTNIYMELIGELYKFLIIDGNVCRWLPQRGSATQIYDQFSYDSNFFELAKYCLGSYLPDKRKYLGQFKELFIKRYNSGYGKMMGASCATQVKEKDAPKIKIRYISPSSIDGSAREDESATEIQIKDEHGIDYKRAERFVNTFQIMQEVIRTQRYKPNPTNAKRFAYIYTEYLSQYFQDVSDETELWGFKTYQKELLKEYDADFAHLFFDVPMSEAIDTFDKITQLDLRPLADFLTPENGFEKSNSTKTQIEEDSGKKKRALAGSKCGFHLDEYVYIEQIRLSEQKLISASNIRQIKMKFTDILKMMQ